MFNSINTPHPIALGLQGGGAHGAFTWGVLDALLETGQLAIEGISGTSAGALNAALFAHGLLENGADGARAALAQFWESIAVAPLHLGARPTAATPASAFDPTAQMMGHWTHFFSPYALNPFDINPLRSRLEAQIDFERLRHHCPVKLFIAATHANSGKLRLFGAHELTSDSLLASACLPSLHHAIVIEGEPYWDGGYAANPAVSPLFFKCHAADILLVLLGPLRHAHTPHSAQEIRERALEIGFNSAFLQEMGLFAHARQYSENSLLPLGRFERRLQRTHFHIIEAETVLEQLGSASKLVPDAAMLGHLRELGRSHAQQWLAHHREALGKRSTVDLTARFT